MLLNRWDLVAATLLIRRRKKKEASVYVRNCSEASSHIARKGHFLRFFFSNSHRVNRCTASCAFIIIVFFFSQMRTTHTHFFTALFSPSSSSSLHFYACVPPLPFFFFHVRCSADPHKYTRRVVFQGVFYIFSFSFFVLHFVQIPLLLNSIGLLKKLSSPFFFFQVACVCVRLLVLLSCVVSTLHYISCPYFLFFFFHLAINFCLWHSDCTPQIYILHT